MSSERKRWLATLLACAGLAVGEAGCAPELRLEPATPSETRSLDAEVLQLIAAKSASARREPSSARAHGSLGLAYEANGLWDAAEKSFDNAARLEPREPLWRYHRAIVLREAGRTPESDVLLREAARELPDDIGVLQRFGQNALDAGDLAPAREAFLRCLALRPDQPECLAGLAGVGLAAEDFARARALLEHALRIDPGYKSAHYALGLALRGLGRDEDAARELALGLSARVRYLDDPLSAELASYRVNGVQQLEQAAQLMTAGLFAAAADLLEKVAKKRPGDKSVLSNLGAACVELGRNERAIEVLSLALALDEKEFAVHINLAECYLRTQKIDLARRHADRAVELAPDVEKARLVRARSLAAAGSFEKAYFELQRAVKLDPRDALACVALAEVTNRLGRTQEAQVWSRKAVSLDPSQLPARVNLALLSIKLGELDEAQRVVEELEKLAPGNARVLALRAELTRLGR